MFDESLSETKNTRKASARRLWDCGQYLFTINIILIVNEHHEHI